MMHSHDPAGMFIVDPEKAPSPDGVSLRVPQPTNADPSWMWHVVGSCNGLLCIRPTRYMDSKHPSFYDFYLLHPITGETSTLPRLENVKKCDKLCGYGFGFSPISRVYKLVVVMHPTLEPDERKTMVLTVGSKSWRTIGGVKRHHEDPIMPPQEMETVYLNGSLQYWYDYGRSYSIYAFDVESEQLQEFQVSALRDSSWRYMNKLGVLGGCLYLTGFEIANSDVAVVWVMKDYGVEESWAKEFEIRKQFGIQPLKFTEGKLFVKGCSDPFYESLMAYTPGRCLERIEVNGMPRECYSTRLFVPNSVSLLDILCVS